jgi:hypothetical protein
MIDRAQALLREALALPIDERADVAAELLASLDGTETDVAEVEAAWASEIERRARRVLAGDSSGSPWGRRQTARRGGLGLKFLDATIDQVVRFPDAGAPVRPLPSDLLVRRAPVKRFPDHVVYLEAKRRFAFLRSRMIDAI